MTIAFLRAIIIYIAVILAVRVMGKRQIGELKPHELVVTVLVSQIATIPMEDNSMPLINSLVPLMTLVALELFVSVLSMKSLSFRNLMQGKPIFIIRDGKIDQKQMKRLRFTVDDLVDALRAKDMFDVNDVDYAVIETNGTVSVLPKKEKQPVTPGDLKVQTKKQHMPIVIVIDGKPITEYFGDFQMDLSFLPGELKKRGLDMRNILYMSKNGNGSYTIIQKEHKI